MNPTTTLPRPRGARLAGALLLYALTTAASVWLGAQKPPTGASTVISAAITAAGTLAMALYYLRWTGYPRWGFVGAAIILAASALLSPLVVDDPAAWVKDVRPTLWLDPWFIMVVGMTPPSATRSACAPQAAWAGWMLVGAAVLFTLIVWGTTAFAFSA